MVPLKWVKKCLHEKVAHLRQASGHMTNPTGSLLLPRRQFWNFAKPITVVSCLLFRAETESGSIL